MYGEALILTYVTVFGYETFKEVIKVKWRSLGWALIQYNGCPKKKWRR